MSDPRLDFRRQAGRSGRIAVARRVATGGRATGRYRPCSLSFQVFHDPFQMFSSIPRSVRIFLVL
jgi:hypothetical protein